MNRKLSLLALLLLAAMLVTQCGPAPATTEPTQAAVAEVKPTPTEAPAPVAPVAPTEAATEAPAAATEAPTEAPAAATEAPAEAPAAGEIDRTKTVIFDIDGGRVEAPELWNPWVPGHRRDHGFHQALMEPLFILNYQTGQIEPWLGESFTANDTLDVWTLKLRNGIKWSDGEDFNADDVVFTMNMLLNNAEKTLGGAAAQQEWVKEVAKGDDLTIEFRLNKPNPRYQLDYWSVKIWGGLNVMPEHIWKDQDPLTFTNYDPAQGWPVFTGPYKLESVSATEFSYVRDDNWWGATSGWKPLPAPERLLWTWAGPEETRTALMADQQLDSLMDITLGAFQSLKERNPNAIAWSENLPFATLDPCSRTFEFNTETEPWNDKDLRWAINYAINRDQIVEIAMYDYTHPADSTGLSDAYEAWRNADAANAEWVTMNVDRANELLDAAGLARDGDVRKTADGTEMSYDINVVTGWSDWVQSCDIMAQNLADIGIQAKVQPYDFGAWYDRVSQGDFDLSIGWSPPGATPFNFYRGMMASATKQDVGQASNENWHRYANEQADALLEQFAATSDDAEQKAIVVELQQLYSDNAPAIPLFPGPQWAEFNTMRITDVPSAENPYVIPSTYENTGRLILITTIKP